jgi:hypothetical protein
VTSKPIQRNFHLITLCGTKLAEIVLAIL